MALFQPHQCRRLLSIYQIVQITLFAYNDDCKKKISLVKYLGKGEKMFLKSLEINGFKSFADKTHIDFADGITSLLGPNGCGKSNIVDSIKWVLGEQSTKTLRASRMDDVIFAGTETRKPREMAEVTLTIDNEDHKLMTDVPEIVIRRRI